MRSPRLAEPGNFPTLLAPGRFAYNTSYVAGKHKARFKSRLYSGCLFSCCLVIVVHITYTAAGPIDVSNYGTQELMAAADGSIWKKISFISLFMMAFAIAGWRSMAASIPIPFLLTFFWCLLSSIWAIDPAISVRRSASMIMISLAISTCIRELGTRETLRVIYVFLTTIVIASYISVALSKLSLFSYAIHPSNESDPTLIGAWRGVFLHKNVAGAVMTYAAAVFLHFGINRKKPIDWVLFVSALVFLVGTKSKTSIGLAALTLCCGVAYRVLFTKRRGTFLVAACVSYVILFACFWSALNYEDIEHYLSNPMNLSGRIAVWTSLMSYINDHPWLGSGYGSFWAIGYQSPIYSIATKSFILQIGHSHSGYFEVLLSTGIIGLIFVFFAFILEPSFRFLTMPYRDRVLGGMCVSLWLFGILQNFTESQLFAPDKESWLFILLTICIIHNNHVARLHERKYQAHLRTIALHEA